METPKEDTNRRNTPRFRAGLSDFVYFPCLGRMDIRDLSSGGLYAADMDKQYLRGTELEMELCLGSDIIPARGMVIRTDRGEGFAVAFIGGPLDIRAKMARSLDSLAAAA